jgi:predicted nucleotidyltransferase
MAVEVEDVLQTRREEILRIAAKHGAFDVRVFGSRSRGEAGADSDFDFLVKVGPDRTPWFPVEVVTEAGLHPLIRDQVLKEAVPL